MSWRPLLEGELAARAEDALRAIGNELPEPPYPSVGGKAGVALFYAYLGDTGRADAILERAVDALATTPMRPSLFGGYTGLAWTAEHLGRLLGDTPDDMSDEIDESLLAAIAAPWDGDYDLVSGLTGFGVYALERAPHPSAVRCLEAIVDRLDQTAERIEPGVTWYTAPELLFPHQREQYPRGGYNVGVAHGVPGVLTFLAAVCRLGIRLQKARPLLEGAVRWVLSRQLPGHHGASFPAWLLPEPGAPAHPSRLAWCYGDPGIAASLFCAARAVGNEAWQRTAIDLGLRAAAAPPDHSGVQDAGLCHGAFGLAHIYNRLHQSGGGEPFAEAALHWYQRGLDLRRPGHGIAGFQSWELGPDRKLDWRTDPGFLTGATGIGLALIAALSPTEPDWDRLMMLSLRLS